MAASVTEPLYTRDILRLAASIPGQRGFGEVDGPEVRSPTCGSRVAMRVALDGAGRVAELEQAVEACAFGQAAAALVGARAVGMSAEDAAEALAGAERWLAGRELPFAEIGVLEPARPRRGRHGAILLPFRALVAAIGAAAR